MGRYSSAVSLFNDFVYIIQLLVYALSPVLWLGKKFIDQIKCIGIFAQEITNKFDLMFFAKQYSGCSLGDLLSYRHNKHKAKL